MSELQAKLSDMRAAAEQLRTSGRRVDASVQGAADVIDGLFALGMTDATLQVRYLAFRGQMTEWAGKLVRFADELTDAANTVEAATQGTMPVFMLPRRPSRDLTMGLPTAREIPHSEEAAGTVALMPFSYIAAHNQPLYEQWEQRRDLLETKEANLAGLMQTRADTAADLTALRHRIYSFDPDVDVDSIPRVQALTGEVAALDAQITGLEREIGVIQGQLDVVTERLNWVTPVAGADIATIAAMEGTASPAWLSENTFDCVNHVVNKLHIPPDIARDAYLWIEKIGEFPEYGVQVGDVPLEGSVLWMPPEHPYADNQYGHVMYVEQVLDGGIWITDNNHPTDPVRLTDITQGGGDQIRYLYFPWHTKG